MNTHNGKEENALSLQEVVCQNCGAHFDKYKEFCPKCGLKIGSYPPAEIYIRPTEQGAFSRASGILALLSFIFGLFGPLILGIGWLLGIIIGFNVVHTIRRKGGFIRDQRLASWGIIFGFLWIILASLVVGIISYQKVSKSKLKENEMIAISTLKNIALAERYIKIGCYIDSDKNGFGEYASLDELYNIHQPYLKTELDQQVYRGYLFTIHEVSETTFLADALPIVYEKTGVSTFYITQEGFIRGGDIQGKSIINSDVILPRLFQDKNVYDDFNEQMAQQLLNLAKRLAYEKHDFIRVNAIFSGIKSFFPLSKSIEDLERLSVSVENLIQEEEASNAFQKAKALKSEKKDKEYLSALRSIKDTFPQAKIISEVEKEIMGLNLKFKKELETEAMQYIEKLFALSVEKDFEAILTTANSIKNRYPATEAFNKIKDKIEGLLAKAHFYKLKNEGLNYFKGRDFSQAIISLKKAEQSSSHADSDILNALSKSYLQEAYIYFKENNWTKSFSNFQDYFSLKSSLPDGKSKKIYASVCLKIADLAFLKGDIKEATKFLDFIKDYPSTPGYAYLKGSIEAANQKYEEAINIFNQEDLKSIENNKADNLLAKKSLCYMALYLKKEEELFKFFENEKLFKEKGERVALDTAELLQNIFKAELELQVKLKPVVDPTGRERQDQKIARVLAPAEAIAKLNEFRKTSQTIAQDVQENNIAIEKVVNILQDMKKCLKDCNIFLSQSTSLEIQNYTLRKYEVLLRRKDYLHNQAIKEITSGIEYFKDIQEECMSLIDDAVDDFAERKSVSKYVKELDSYFQSIPLDKSSKEIEKAKYFFKKSSEIKVPIAEYLASID